MRTAKELSRKQLETIVESVQEFMYRDLGEGGTDVWNPDKSWPGADVCQHVVSVLGEHGLVPEEPMPAS